MRIALVAGLALAALLAGCAEKEVILPGERFDVRTPLDASIPTEGEPAPTDTGVANRSVPITLPSPVVNADWTHRGSNARHLAPHVALSAQPARVWTADIGEGNSRRNRIATTPVVAGGQVFTLDSAGTVTATSAGGATAWQVSLVPPNDSGSEASGGGLAFGDGKVFVTTVYGELVALDPATGGVVWRQRFLGPVTSAPTVAEGIVYVVGDDNSAWAVTVSDGRLRWEIPAAPSTPGRLGGAGPAVAGDLVLLPFPSGQLVGALRKGGVEVWRASVAGRRLGRAYGLVSEISADPVVAGPVTYVGNASGRLVALETRSGEQIWAAVEGATTTVALGGGSIFLVNDESRLVRLDADTGEVIWQVELPYFVNDKPNRRKAIFAHYGPILAGGRLVIASSDGLLRFFSPTDGSLVGSLEIPGGAAAAPVAAGGAIYVVGAEGQLHAFR
jgi:outer membrane protein assembly factor BamB